MNTASPDSRLRYRTLRELVQHALLEDILANRFQPGQRLVEGELAAMYGVSRAPVREAVRALAEQGLVRSISNKGIIVSRLSPEEIREVYEIRLELEPLAARLAAPRLQNGDLGRLHDVLDQMDVVLDDPRAWLALNNEFHMLFYEASGRDRLCRTIGELTNVVEPYIRLFLNVPGMLRETHQDHYQILAAAERHDAGACAELTRRHLQEGADLIVRLSTEDEG